METTSTLDSVAGASQTPADVSPLDGIARPKRDRRQTLTKVDRRSVIGRRVYELKELFTSAAGGELTGLRAMKIGIAAETVALAEAARGALLRSEGGNLDEVIRLERRAAAACRAIGVSVF
jgi:hypothetical protein